MKSMSLWRSLDILDLLAQNHVFLSGQVVIVLQCTTVTHTITWNVPEMQQSYMMLETLVSVRKYTAAPAL